MTKREFLNELKKGLAGLPEEDIERSIEFYGEMIDDRIEEGKTEEEAVADIGTVKDAVSQILSEIPISRLIKEKVKPKRKMHAWEIVLLVLGSPIWFSLLVAAFAVIMSVYIVAWSVVVALWAVFASLAASALDIIALGVINLCHNNPMGGIGMMGASLVCAGMAILFFFGCKLITKCSWFLTKLVPIGVKNCFIKKEDA